MSRPRDALARFCLEFVAMLLGFDDPGREFELRAALTEADPDELARQVEGLARKHRRAYADHRRLVEPAISELRGEYIVPEAGKLLAATALHAIRSSPTSFSWGAGIRGGAVAEAIDDAFRASQRQDERGVTRALPASLVRQAPAPLDAILQGITLAYGDELDDGEIVERLPAPRRSTPPPGFDLDRGRQSRADIVLAVLRAHDVQLREVERGRLRPVTRDDLAEAILRDPFWDDIDASVQEDGVVDGILRHGKPSPAIDLTAFGQPQVYIKRIVR